MRDVAAWATWLASPLTLSLMLGMVSGWCAARHRRRSAWLAATLAVCGLWVASMPFTATALAKQLERGYAPLSLADTPQADAIVVLGGAVSGALPPERPNLSLGPAASRVWHWAALYRAGKARAVVVAAGGRAREPGERIEAEVIGEMLSVLGVPAGALRLDTRSLNTLENAEQSLPLVRGLGARRVLLVTSALHMPRAVKSFTKEWAGSTIEIVPVPVDFISSGGLSGLNLWLPTASALLFVTAALKEFAGMAVLAMI